MPLLRPVLVVIFAFTGTCLRAQTYPQTVGIDPAFRPAVETLDGAIYALVAQSDGKFYVGGQFSRINGVPRRNLARLKPNGEVDLAFDPAGGPDAAVRSIALQTDGRIVVAGDFSSYRSASRERIARVKLDGTLDETFDSPFARQTASIYALAVQADGKILAGGFYNFPNLRTGLVRLTSTGAVDSTFAAQGGPDASVYALEKLEGNRFLVGGSFAKYAGAPRHGVALIDANGTLDATFKNETPSGLQVSAIRAAPDGKYIVGAQNASANLIQLAANGAWEKNLPIAVGADCAVTAIGFDVFERILVAGALAAKETGHQRMARFHSDGTLDTTWSDASIDDSVHALLVQRTGRVVIGGAFNSVGGISRPALARLDVDGSVDPELTASVMGGGVIRVLERQIDGKLVIAGSFTRIDGEAREYVARLNADGSLDREFKPTLTTPPLNPSIYQEQVSTVALQADGRILISGDFSAVNGQPVPKLARLNANGSFDLSFNPGTGPDGRVTAMREQSDGKIILAGSFSNYAGVRRYGVARILSNGTLDTSFDPTGSGLSTHGITRVEVDSQGRILVLGSGGFDSFASDGSKAGTFRLPLNNSSWLRALQLAPDGKFFIGGIVDINYFLTDDYVGGKDYAVARFSSSGRLDTSFAKVSYSDYGVVGDMCLQGDGRLIVGRAANAIGFTTNTVGLVRYEASGTIDSSFTALRLRDPGFYRLLLLSNGTLIGAGGRFYDGAADRDGIVRFAAATAPNFTSPSTAVFVRGTETSFTLTATGVPAPLFTLVGGELPSWLSWNATSGILSGVATGATGTVAQLVFKAANGVGGESLRTVSIVVKPRPGVKVSPGSIAVAPGGEVTLTATAEDSLAPAYQWRKNGVTLTGETGATLKLTQASSSTPGAYTVALTDSVASTESEPAFVEVTSTAKVIGAANELEPRDIRHPNGNVFDQVLLEGDAATITADYSPNPELNQITRISFIDLDNDIVQVEFSGPGSLSLVLQNPAGPALPVNYNQKINYMKGHAGIVITGATERTHVTVFSVGRATAVNQALFRSDVSYGGTADLAFIAIASFNGRFGGVRAANARFYATSGMTGVFAPNVHFEGPVYVGNISAFDAARPVIQLGSVADARITGGDLWQANGRELEVAGITRLLFSAGSDSHGNLLGAEINQATLVHEGEDVTEAVIAYSPKQ